MGKIGRQYQVGTIKRATARRRCMKILYSLCLHSNLHKFFALSSFEREKISPGLVNVSKQNSLERKNREKENQKNYTICIHRNYPSLSSSVQMSKFYLNFVFRISYFLILIIILALVVWEMRMMGAFSLRFPISSVKVRLWGVEIFPSLLVLSLN